MSPLNLALSLTLGLAGPDGDASTSALEQAVLSASPTLESARQIAAALTEAETRAIEIAKDEDSLVLLDRARLALVSIHLAVGDEAEAEAAMDEVIRSAMGREVAAGSFGPTVLALYERRLQALQADGVAQIEITCGGCEVIINETKFADSERPLFLGEYRVWVVFSDRARAPERLEIKLREPGMVARRTFDAGVVLATSAAEVRDRRARLLPRWAELSMFSAGVALLVSGIALMALDKDCRGDEIDPITGKCAKVYDNTPQGQILLGLGAGLTVAAGVVLTVDEVRVGRARGRRAMVTWSIQF